MYSGQSIGFATNEGDQQYVNGTSRYSASEGPIVAGTGLRLNDLFRHKLMTSESLQQFVILRERE